MPISYLRRLTVALTLALAANFTALNPAAAQGNLIAEIQERGTLRVGVAESPPWQSPNPSTSVYEGFNIDLAARVAEIMGVKLEIVPATWSTLVAGLEAGQYDFVGANLFATPPRALVVDFTNPYSTYGFHIVVNADSKITSMDQLNDPAVTFVGMSGTVEETYPTELFPNAKVRAIATNDIGAWIGEVAAGQADAAFLDPGTYQILVPRRWANACACSTPRTTSSNRSGWPGLSGPTTSTFSISSTPSSTTWCVTMNTSRCATNGLT